MTAVSSVDVKSRLLAEGQDKATMSVYTDLFDAKDDLVARTTATWTISPKPAK